MRLIDADKLKAIIIEGHRKEFFGSVLWNILDDMPTVTKTDICREYFEMLKQNIPFELVNDNTKHLLEIMEKLIVETEVLEE